VSSEFRVDAVSRDRPRLIDAGGSGALERTCPGARSVKGVGSLSI